MTKRGETAHLTISKTKFVLKYRWKCGALAKFCVASKFETGNAEKFEDTSILCIWNIWLSKINWQNGKNYLLSHIKIYEHKRDKIISMYQKINISEFGRCNVQSSSKAAIPRSSWKASPSLWQVGLAGGYLFVCIQICLLIVILRFGENSFKNSLPSGGRGYLFVCFEICPKVPPLLFSDQTFFPQGGGDSLLREDAAGDFWDISHHDYHRVRFNIRAFYKMPLGSIGLFYRFICSHFLNHLLDIYYGGLRSNHFKTEDN